ncbi:hypothetical protein [Helicobacter felistomachi]|uniref:hypothetical protein n=1 Tax=Helicobacter felistomachi TaxID=3040201 RepID=UPI0025745638|nr:hypothetical protein [Helicobacter sp. NHP21005]
MDVLGHLSKNEFIVPPCQRGYAWGRASWAIAGGCLSLVRNAQLNVFAKKTLQDFFIFQTPQE